MYAHTQVGSTELYPDSREETILVPQNQITRIMDTYPSQRPIPSLGGGDDAEINEKMKLVDLVEKGNICAAKYIENEDM